GGFRVIVWSLVLAAVGAGFLLVGFALDPRQAFASYLVAYFFVFTVAIGLIAFVMGAHAMRAAWPSTVRRLAELGLGAMPLIAALLLPLLAAPPLLFPWAHPESVTEPHAAELLAHRIRIWLHRPAWDLRAVFYVAVCTVAAALLRRWS